jgi:ApaG protein
MSTTTTDGIEVQVQAAFWPERSAPDRGQWAFQYTVRVSNTGSRVATLRARHWVITDATGRVEEVRGDGVVGKQPRLEPGAQFEYTSWAMLRTPYGSMHGEYLMERADSTRFEAKIGEFVLAQPNSLH